MRVIISILFACLASGMAKGITLKWPTHNATDTVWEYDIRRLCIMDCASGDLLRKTMSKVSQSKHFENFSMRFSKSNFKEGVLVEIADVNADYVYDNIENMRGVVCLGNHQKFFVFDYPDNLWSRFLSSGMGHEHLVIDKYSVPDFVYIVYPDISTCCVAEFRENKSKILYYVIDGKLVEEDDDFRNYLQAPRGFCDPQSPK